MTLFLIPILPKAQKQQQQKKLGKLDQSISERVFLIFIFLGCFNLHMLRGFRVIRTRQV